MMKSNNLYNRIYDHSFSLLLTFSFYAIFFALLLSCEDEEALSEIKWSENSFITTEDGTTYTVGYDQKSANNQDSFVEKRDDRGAIVWKVSHAASPIDERAVLVTLDDEGNPWVIFSVNGGSYDEGYITKKFTAPDAFENVYQNNYGQGDGAKVAVVAKLDPEDGKIVKGSFLGTHLNNGKTNSLNIKKIGVHNTEVLLDVETAVWPPAAGKTYEKMAGITDEDRVNNAFHLQLSLNPNLSEIWRSELKK
ncbi:hypothetical protein [Catalinimonas niigatensis]|uniref:hypothetical protein n=1 Tax=Catalinimonas niigatensis TaxID=1397264 RepID=UPI0026661950|nr:hypothetical protein [Catalinimonas niigatensis]WPP48050.1 hypothetical protein PZB72_15340 [Catalinimonas niigatensis]